MGPKHRGLGRDQSRSVIVKRQEMVWTVSNSNQEILVPADLVRLFESGRGC